MVRSPIGAVASCITVSFAEHSPICTPNSVIPHDRTHRVLAQIGIFLAIYTIWHPQGAEILRIGHTPARDPMSIQEVRHMAHHAAPMQGHGTKVHDTGDREGAEERIPGYVYAVGAIAALAGLLFGYDTGVISGAELYLVKSFKLTAFTEELAISSVLIGAVIGASIAGRLADVFSRKLSLIVMAIIFAIGAVLTAIAPTLAIFIACRIIVGFAIGASSMIAPTYIAEQAPESIRGGLVILQQLAITVGIAVSYWVDLLFVHLGMDWRPMFAVAVIPAIIFGVGMLFLSFSPRWLASRDRWDEAEQVMAKVAPDAQEQEMKALHESMEEQSGTTWRDLLAPGLRLALTAAVGIAVLQQFVGINTVIYYAPTIFGYAGFKSANTAILATSVVGVTNVVSTVVAVLLIDRVGRKPLLLVGLVGMVITLTALGIVFMIGPSNVGPLVLICLEGYVISFAISMGPAFWLISAEMFPTRLRATGSSIATTFEWAANLLISITFLTFIQVLGKSVTFWIYAAFAVIAFAFVIWLIPETKGKRLEEIEEYWRNGRKWPSASESQAAK
jgi:sugar porter (SP) family MFS transporter